MRESIPRVIAATLFFIAGLTGAAILPPGSALYAGQSIYSDNQQYMLTMQGDGNLVYYRVADGAVRWNTGTSNLPGGFLAMQGDGNAVTYYDPPPLPAQKGEPVYYKEPPARYATWYSATAGNAGAYLKLQDDGNLVVASASGQTLWGIGSDPDLNKPEPKQPGDVVGRDLVGWLAAPGHIGYFDGTNIYQVMNEFLVVQYVTVDNFKSTFQGMSRMKKLHWTLLGMAGLVSAFALYYSFASEASQAGLPTAQPSALAALARTSGSTGKPSANGTAEYRANVAVAASRIDEQNPLRAYKPTPGIPGRIALEEMRAKGIPATPLSATLALGLLRSGQLSDDERIAMTSVLSALYNRENTSGANERIALELKKLAADPNKQIASGAATSYARLGYLPDTKHVLDGALQSGALDADSYFREMAHRIPSAPPEKQKEFMAEIRGSSNRLASDILADALNSGQDFNAAPFLKSSEDMAKLLRDTEPDFGQDVGLYGGTDGLRYETWLRASATIESAKTGRSMNDIIVAKLSEPGTDPRKVLAYLSSWEAMPLLTEAAPDSQVQKLAAIARRHSDQNPGNSYMRFLAETIEARMKNPPPAAPKPVFKMPTGPAVPPGQTPHELPFTSKHP